VGDAFPFGLMPEFHPSAGGARLVLDEMESAILRQLVGEMRALLAGQKRADDPVVDRLFPAAYETADDEAAYREIVGDDLAKEKLKALDLVSTSLSDGPSDVVLTGDDFGTWLACLTDLRLAIGTRLDVDEERMGTEIDPNDPDAQALSVLHWLGWLQEGLLRAATTG
jgi:hypothetical protein